MIFNLQEIRQDIQLILDFVHADEYLWKVASSLLGETNDQRTKWVAQRAMQMLSGETEQIIAEFRRLAQEPIRKRQRHARLHNIPFPSRALPEAQSLALISSPTRSREHSIAAQNRQDLPLAA